MTKGIKVLRKKTDSNANGAEIVLHYIDLVEDCGIDPEEEDINVCDELNGDPSWVYVLIK
jgi:hypothetical protein